ncbi:hypothetical protein LIER_19355 [Lithospermum erythrorhizon]|uniref:Transducin family protein / WD-40 repeat family protein n=1 Tax=Lithospermum erythrorhizon TaxID=34254 RepID=A0AAV3QIE0_LITER
MRSQSMSSSSSIWPEIESQPSISQLPSDAKNNSDCNIYQLLATREVCPRTKHSFKKIWDKGSTSFSDRIRCKASTDARRGLISWVEAESMRHLSAKYCPLSPPPRSTIAAAFSPDGLTLASTHGDHTVKLIDWQTGRCLKVLSGHRRTPWVVRFHPLHPEVLASGSLDHEVRLWDAKHSECLKSHDFYRPIASIAFHPQGDILAVASGHKLYIWHYNRRGESSSPAIILKTRRSLRAVHFHPHAALFLLTAEVNDLDSSDSSMTLATSPGYLRYPPPTVYLTDGQTNPQPHPTNIVPAVSLPFLIWPSSTRLDGRSPVEARNPNIQQRVDTSASVRLLTYSTPSGQYELLISPIEATDSSPQEPHTSTPTTEMENTVSQTEVDAMETDVQHENRGNQFFPFNDPAYTDLPLLQGWLASQNQPSQRPMHLQNGAGYQSVSNNEETPTVPASNVTNLRTAGRSGSRRRSSRNVGADLVDSQPFTSRLHSEIATSLAAAAAAELPCTVKLRIWPHDIRDPCAPLESDKCRLIIPHAVLCSEMGAHFSPCGRFLAACVACVLPNMESDPGSHGVPHPDVAGAGTSPTRHPISAHQIMYELRIYSLEEATFGSVLASRAIRAAHCLTSIQFSPTSEHLLLAYGRRHNSLLKNVVIDGEATVAIYTILEVYRVSDMELVKVLPSAEDEVNVACFHPSVGNGLVYGTKEGKLRIFQSDASQVIDHTGTSFPVDHMLEVPTYALEG